jgi:hypothetical protein
MPIQEGATAAYPQAERLELREELHGREVADPYRWLEDTGDPRTREWSAGQDELFAACQARWLGGAANPAPAAPHAPLVNSAAHDRITASTASVSRGAGGRRAAGARRGRGAGLGRVGGGGPSPRPEAPRRSA